MGDLPCLSHAGSITSVNTAQTMAPRTTWLSPTSPAFVGCSTVRTTSLETCTGQLRHDQVRSNSTPSGLVWLLAGEQAERGAHGFRCIDLLNLYICSIFAVLFNEMEQ